jgi:hypothetical protein
MQTSDIAAAPGHCSNITFAASLAEKSAKP